MSAHLQSDKWIGSLLSGLICQVGSSKKAKY